MRGELVNLLHLPRSVTSEIEGSSPVNRAIFFRKMNWPLNRSPKIRHPDEGFPGSTSVSGAAAKCFRKNTFSGIVEATAGIEPAYTALQAAASPLRHVAPSTPLFEGATS